MTSVFGSSKDDLPAAKGEVLGQQPIASVVPTGIAGFDEILGQGLPTGNLYLLSGSLGSNTDLFAQQVLYNTLIRKGKVAYYTVERSSTDIIVDMQLFGMNVQQYVDDGSCVFARIVPDSMKKIMDVLPEVPMEQRVYLEGALANIMNHFHERVKEGRNTALHLSQLVRNFPIDEIQNLLFFMAGAARKYGGIHFLLLTEDAHEQRALVTIKDAADSVFEVSSEIRGAEIENMLTIQKIRGILPKTRIIRFTTRENGLVTETIRRI